MKRVFYLILASMCVTIWANAQKLRFSQPHGFYDAEFTTEILCDVDLPEGVIIHYTLDGSEPTLESPIYTQPLHVKGNTIVRAVALSDTEAFTKVTSATYLFLDDVLKQTNTPEGYPAEWGSYTDIWGTAIADYEMDPEMTSDPVLAEKIREGFLSLPVLSILTDKDNLFNILTDKDNLFNPEPDPDTGGIYIFTGPPVGDNTGHGWTRFANVELFGGTYLDEHGNEVPHDMHVSCGLRLHGGHGRLAEKNPKRRNMARRTSNTLSLERMSPISSTSLCCAVISAIRGSIGWSRIVGKHNTPVMCGHVVCSVRWVGQA